jgi:hypothetical protein
VARELGVVSVETLIAAGYLPDGQIEFASEPDRKTASTLSSEEVVFFRRLDSVIARLEAIVERLDTF